MPIYEYACDKCSHEFEVEQRITEDPVKTCPACRSRKVRRLISQTSFVLKGGGWYSDLYSSSKGSEKSSKEPDKGGPDKDGGSGGSAGASESKSPAGSDSKSDSKPASKGGGKGKGAKAAA